MVKRPKKAVDSLNKPSIVQETGKVKMERTVETSAVDSSDPAYT